MFRWYPPTRTASYPVWYSPQIFDEYEVVWRNLSKKTMYVTSLLMRKTNTRSTQLFRRERRLTISSNLFQDETLTKITTKINSTNGSCSLQTLTLAKCTKAEQRAHNSSCIAAFAVKVKTVTTFRFISYRKVKLRLCCTTTQGYCETSGTCRQRLTSYTVDEDLNTSRKWLLRDELVEHTLSWEPSFCHSSSACFLLL